MKKVSKKANKIESAHIIFGFVSIIYAQKEIHKNHRQFACG
jgi:hypothetical protein